MIELKNITKQFQLRNRIVTALSDVSLKVPKGKIFGVIGASGAGKSTLIRCVNLLERPTSGEVIVDGINLIDLSSAQLAKERRQIGMIFQHFNLLSSRTVFDNVAFPLELDKLPKAEIEERVNALLALVGLHEKQDDYPASLSGGQKQRVAIARAIVGKPEIILADEPTGNLDSAMGNEILSILQSLNEGGATIVMVTHDDAMAKRTHRLVRLFDGTQVL